MPRMSYESIQKQIEKLQAQAKKLEANHLAKKGKSISQVRALMKKLNVSVEDLQQTGQKHGEVNKPRKTRQFLKKSSGARGPVAPKYRDPTTGETWTGRGKPPKWLAAHLAKGNSKEAFLIASESVAPAQVIDEALVSHAEVQNQLK